MRNELTSRQAGLAAEVDDVLAVLGAGRSGPDYLRELGRRRLLAVHYPHAYGGRGLDLECHAAVAERMGDLGLPDVAQVISVQGVGCTILTKGTPHQRDTWLPGLADGTVVASLLLSEVRAGSDLAAIGTTATPTDGGWTISGEKAWSIHTAWSTVALVSARTRPALSRADGVSLFLVDLDAAGVTSTEVPRRGGSPYVTVRFDDVAVGGDRLVGELDEAWRVLPLTIAYERTGFDYLTRGRRWLDNLEAAMRQGGLTRDHAVQLVRLRLGLESARALAYQVVHNADGLEMDDVEAAYGKLACGRAAQDVVACAVRELPAQQVTATDWLAAAVAEAPEFTVSGGAMDLQLDAIANEFPIAGSFS